MNELTQATKDTMKYRLVIIKQGHIVYEDPNRTEDEFSTKGVLYKALD